MDAKEVLKKLDVKKGISLKSLSRKLNLDQETLNEMLEQLELDLRVIKKKNGDYIKTEDATHFTGILEMSEKGFGFLVKEDGSRIFIHKEKLNGALHKDRILIETYTLADKRVYGNVLKVHSKKHRHVGLVYEKNGEYFVKLDDKKFPFPVRLNHCHGAFLDNKVVVEFTSGLEGNCYHADVIEVIGHKLDPRVDVLSIMKELEIPSKFGKEVMKEVEQIPDVVMKEELENRLDLRKETIFTIDGDTAKDFDDAVSIEKLANGNYKLGVHIADVSHYVKENTALDNEAYFRGVSVYTPGYVTPMLPHKLSNGICSLNPDVDRLTLSCIMEISSDGEVIGYDIVPSVIHSKKRMTYQQVNQVLDGKTPSDYLEYQEDLKLMLELSKILRKKREEKGSLNFDTGEMVIDTNEFGRPMSITKYERGEGEKIIEDFMIVANESVASYAHYLQSPFIYRVHKVPGQDKIVEFVNNASKLGIEIDLPRGQKIITPKMLQTLLEKYKNHPNYPILSNLLLRSMKKAEYLTSNQHHFGLALKNYTHFTSPIRRYPDLMVHRTLKSLIRGEYQCETFHDTEVKYQKIAEQSSMCERRSEECEREVAKMKSAEFLEDKTSLVYNGVITGMDVKRKKAYVTLDNLIQGEIDLKEDCYLFDEQKWCFTSLSKRVLSLGTSALLKLVRADKEKRVIQFCLLDDEIEKMKQKKMKLSLFDFNEESF